MRHNSGVEEAKPKDKIAAIFDKSVRSLKASSGELLHNFRHRLGRDRGLSPSARGDQDRAPDGHLGKPATQQKRTRRRGETRRAARRAAPAREEAAQARASSKEARDFEEAPLTDAPCPEVVLVSLWDHLSSGFNKSIHTAPPTDHSARPCAAENKARERSRHLCLRTWPTSRPTDVANTKGPRAVATAEDQRPRSGGPTTRSWEAEGVRPVQTEPAGRKHGRKGAGAEVEEQREPTGPAPNQ